MPTTLDQVWVRLQKLAIKEEIRFSHWNVYFLQFSFALSHHWVASVVGLSSLVVARWWTWTNTPPKHQSILARNIYSSDFFSERRLYNCKLLICFWAEKNVAGDEWQWKIYRMKRTSGILLSRAIELIRSLLFNKQFASICNKREVASIVEIGTNVQYYVWWR